MGYISINTRDLTSGQASALILDLMLISEGVEW